jgi:putative tryptophan/tyrosine transport system substrate-binding protein
MHLSRGKSPRSLNRALGLVVAVLFAIVVLGCGSDDDGGGSGASADAAAKKTIGVALIAPVDLLENNITAFKDELAKQGYTEGENVTYKDYNAQGQISNVGTIVKQLGDLEPDLVYAVGTPLVLGFMQKYPQTPIVFGVMSDPVGAKVAKSLEQPGGTATGSTGKVPPDVTFDIIAEALPDAKHVGVIGNVAEPNTVSEIDALKGEAEKRGIELEVKAVTATSEVASAIRSLEGIDALVVPGDNTVVSAIATVAKTSQQLGIPTFDPYGSELAEQGIMVAFGPNYEALGRESAKQAAKILKGGNPGDIPVVGLGSGVPNEIYVNEAAAEAVGVELSPEFREKVAKFVP